MMGKAFVSMDYTQLDRLQKYIANYEGESLRIIDDVMHTTAPDIIQYNIHRLLPYSGRTWKGKKKAARDTQPFMADNSEMLATTVKTKKNYGYLYFPDDGSNSDSHVGNQNFTGRGAEASKPEIIDTCIGRLIGAFYK